ncbi:MAG: hypothetical protein EXS13_13575 [Planctomycetes bacterium]|nr:hypothetical protein [Planctomycetota bacterium]
MRTFTALFIGAAIGASFAPQPAARLGSLVADTVAVDDPLAPLEPFTAHDWVATFPNGKLTDTQRYEWMLGKKFLRNPHQVRDADGKVVYEGETIYGFDAATKALRWWYFNATGGWIDGTVAEEPDGTLLFEGVNHAGSNQTAKVRSTSLFEGEQWTSTT